MNANDFKVSVRCKTYNQSAYIEDALNGFTMQQTDFPFICVVMDDASTDGEQEVISRYLEKHFDLSNKSVVKKEETDDYAMTLAQHKENRNCYFAVYFLKYNHYCKKDKTPYFSVFEESAKYIASCEGDDYWTYPEKLQCQVAIMDADDNISMCHTAFSFLDDGDNYLKAFDDSVIKSYHKDYNTKSIICGILDNNNYRIQSVAMMLRKTSYMKIRNLLIVEGGSFLMGDTQLMACLASVGRIVYVDKNTSVYRRHTGSACRPKYDKGIVRFNLSVSEMQSYFGALLNVSRELELEFQRRYKCNYLKYKALYDINYKPFVSFAFDNNIEKKLFWLKTSYLGLSLYRLLNKLKK